MATRNRLGDRNRIATDPVVSAGVQNISQQLQRAGSRRRISCRDLDSLTEIENTNLEDDRTETGTQTQTGTTTPGGRDLTIGRRAGIRRPGIDLIGSEGLQDISDRARDAGFPTFTVTEPEPPSREDALNSLDSGEEDDFRDIPGQFLSAPFLGLGKTTTITDIENYADSFDKVTQEYSLERSKIDDHIKHYNGSFYVLRNDSLSFYRNIQNTKRYISLYNSNIPAKGTLISASIETYKFNFQNLKVNGRLRSPLKTRFVNGGNFSGSIEGQSKNNFKFPGIIGRQNNIIDNTFVMQLPFENSELLETLSLVGASIIDVKQNYNFYIEDYEKIANVANTNSKENIFPNLYVLNAILEDNTTDKSFLSSIANLNKRVSSGEKFMLNKSQKVVFGIKDGIGEYFDLFGINYENLRQQEQVTHNAFDRKMNNIVFLSDATGKMAETAKKKYLFPMSIEMSIPTDKTTNVTRMLLDAELMDSFMLQLFNIHKTGGFEEKDSAITEKLYSQEIKPNTQQNIVKTSFNTKRKNIRFENINNMLQEIKQRPIAPSGQDYVVIGDSTKYLKTNKESMSFVSGLRNIIFNSKLNTFVRNTHRTYKDILTGKTCYNETIAFRVSKYNQGETTPIQNYWLPNNPDLDFINLVDTQVKYEKEYTYKVFAYQFVLGNKITQSINTQGQSDTQCGIDVENLPQANLMEVEILSTNKMVADTPPLSPEVLFVPYFDVDNKISLFLNSRTGEEKLEPINILATDEEKTSTYTRRLDNLVLYKTDDVAKRFEIMKLERAPNSYADFADGFVKAVNTDVDPESTQKATAASFIDSIEPNKKYYYCFRTIDIHEKISNPSQVFELEMVNEKGMIYPIIKNYDFTKPAYSNNIEMRRFIKIKPSSQHTFLNSAASNINSDTTAEESLPKIKLGVSDVAVPWGKTFKMVVTSKQTGKKCEFKFRFKYISE
jgi:hypothetical protein